MWLTNDLLCMWLLIWEVCMIDWNNLVSVILLHHFHFYIDHFPCHVCICFHFALPIPIEFSSQPRSYFLNKNYAHACSPTHCYAFFVCFQPRWLGPWLHLWSSTVFVSGPLSVFPVLKQILFHTSDKWTWMEQQVSS